MVAPQDHVEQEETVQRTQKEALSDMKLEQSNIDQVQRPMWRGWKRHTSSKSGIITAAFFSVGTRGCNHNALQQRTS